jgi:ribonuclease BN (tRNA processing enzyme)
MAKIVILGSGSGFATNQRHCTSIALLAERDLYLFDCGEPVGALLFREGIDPLSLKTLFISHMHPDHIGGLASLMFSIYLPGRSGERKFKPWSIHRDDGWYRDSLWFPPDNVEESDDPVQDNRPQITIKMPEEGIEPIRKYLSAVYLLPAILPMELSFEPVRIGMTYDDGRVRVTAVPNDHLKGNFAYQGVRQEYPGNKLQSYSFAGEIEGRKFVYSGDIDRLDELNPLLDGAQILIVEVAHYNPDEIEPFVRDLPLQRVILTHIHPGLEERTAALVKEWNDPRIQIAHDGLQISLED